MNGGKIFACHLGRPGAQAKLYLCVRTPMKVARWPGFITI
jgi:hypothetical protein